ncbi:hypothetical protein BT67DRAFT_380020 [Trichocladium antarcticum]|uniref:ATP synthase subunit K, mitochondrial n=1 Tax=Trichocladium antarcticum TaxID=1450529 RepID=A0AAN6UMN8_9PEZI|nr:hypothetical protein BT67DRAFT_380020 [Trichocladium antarcticum]
MVQKYNIFGTQVASQYLAMGVLGTIFGSAYLFTGGSKSIPAAPPINAASTDEADFIKKFIEQIESPEKPAEAKQ